MVEPRILVAGIGNIFLGDDGFGPEVVRQLTPQPLGSPVRVVDYGIRGMHLAYDLLDGCDALVLIDAIPDRGCPGTVHVFEAELDEDSGPVLDAHGMDPGAVLASLRSLGGATPPTIVVGCEVASVEEQLGLSDVVAAAIPVAVQATHRVLDGLLSESR